MKIYHIVKEQRQIGDLRATLLLTTIADAENERRWRPAEKEREQGDKVPGEIRVREREGEFELKRVGKHS